jgi:hypothetical protein
MAILPLRSDMQAFQEAIRLVAMEEEDGWQPHPNTHKNPKRKKQQIKEIEALSFIM